MLLLGSGNLRKHAEVCSEDELINQISDITSRVDDLLTYTLPPLNCTSPLRVISATATAGQLIIMPTATPYWLPNSTQIQVCIQCYSGNHTHEPSKDTPTLSQNKF